MKKRSEKYDYIIARIKCPKVMECPINGPVISCKECRRTVKQDAATALSTLQAENEKLRAELERMKKIMRDNGIMTIPPKYPGWPTEWNIPKPRSQKED